MQALALGCVGLRNTLDKDRVFHFGTVHPLVRPAFSRTIQGGRAFSLHMGLRTLRRPRDLTVFRGTRTPRSRFHPDPPHISLSALIPFPRLLAILGVTCAKPSQASGARIWYRGSTRIPRRISSIEDAQLGILCNLATRKLCNPYARRTPEPRPTRHPRFVARCAYRMHGVGRIDPPGLRAFGTGNSPSHTGFPSASSTNRPGHV